MATDYVHQPKVFDRHVRVFDKYGGTLIDSLSWKGMPFKMVQKWDWYFRYRAALMQVKYPRFRVDFVMTSRKAEGRSLKRIDIETREKRKIVVKRVVTKCRNAINKYLEEQHKTLIPNMENPKYLKTIDKLAKYTSELDQLDLELKELNS